MSVCGRPAHVVADHQIEQAVAVVVDPQGRRAEARAVAEPGLVGDVDESSVTRVAEQPALADAGDREILAAVVVEVAGGRAHRVDLHVQAGLRRDVLEGSAAGVAEQAQRARLRRRARLEADAAHEQHVLTAVAVGVEHGHARAQRLGQVLAPGRAGGVLEPDAGRVADVHQLKPRRLCREGRHQRRRSRRRPCEAARERRVTAGSPGLSAPRSARARPPCARRASPSGWSDGPPPCWR